MFKLTYSIADVVFFLVLSLNPLSVRADAYPVVPGKYLVVFDQNPGAYALGSYPRTTESYLAAFTYIQQLKEERTSMLAAMEQVAPGVSSRVLQHYYKVLSGAGIEMSEAEAEAIRALPFVSAVEPAPVMEFALDQSRPLTGADAWQLNMPPYKGQGIRVGVIDSGVDYTHPDFGSCVQPGEPDCAVAGGWNFDNDTGDIQDVMAHGTHVASIIASRHPVYGGIAPNARLYVYMVAHNYAPGYFLVLAALERAVDPDNDDDLSDRLDVVNLSLGAFGEGSEGGLSMAADGLVEAGGIVVAATSNHSSRDAVTDPASGKRTIAVGALNGDGSTVADFSNRAIMSDGSFKPDLLAPGGTRSITGQGICAARSSGDNFNPVPFCGEDEQHEEQWGTSMASPHVAGMAALLLERAPWLRPDEVFALLKQRALPLTNPRTGRLYDALAQGHGMARLPDISQEVQHPLIVELERVINDDTHVQFRAIVKIHSAEAAGTTLHYMLSLGRMGSGYTVPGRIDDMPWPEGAMPEQSFYQHPGTLVLDETGTGEILFPAKAKADLPDGLILAEFKVWSEQHQESKAYNSVEKHSILLASPAPCDVVGQGFDFIGTVPLRGSERYSIRYAPAATAVTPDDWSEDGVILLSSGLRPVISGQLGKFSAPEDLPSGVYRFRLSIMGAGEQEISYEDFGDIRFDRDLKWGNPRTLKNNPVYTTPSLSSIFLDPLIPSVFRSSESGANELALPYYSESGIGTEIRRLDSRGRWRRAIPSAPGYALSSTFAVLPGHFGPSLVPGLMFNRYSYPNQTQAIFQSRAQTESGAVLAQAEAAPQGDPLSIPFLSFSALADMNNDGQNESVSIRRTTSSGRILEIRDSNLNLLPGVPVEWVNSGTTRYADSPVIGNFDGDSDLEVAVLYRGDCSGGECFNKIRIHNIDGSSINEHWPLVISTQNRFSAGAVAADLNNDGRDELIVAYFGVLTVYDTANGTLYNEPGNTSWPVNFPLSGPAGIYKYYQPAVGDLDGDGELEIAVVGGDYLETYTNYMAIYAFNSDASPVGDGAWPRAVSYLNESGLLIADLNGNGTDDLLFQGKERLASCEFATLDARDGLTGERIAGFPRYLESQYGSYSFGQTLVDIDEDGVLDLLASSAGGFRTGIVTSYPQLEMDRRYSIYSWSLGVPDTTAASRWNTARANFERTARYTGLAAPVNLEVGPVSAQQGRLALRWSDPGNGNKGSHYVVSVLRTDRYAPEIRRELSSDQRAYTLRGLSAGEYSVRVGSHMSDLGRFAWTKALRVRLSADVGNGATLPR